MPEVDPATHQPVTDSPTGSDDTRGGKEAGDPTLDKATQTGGRPGMTTGQRDGAHVEGDGPLPGERMSEGETGSPQG